MSHDDVDHDDDDKHDHDQYPTEWSVWASLIPILSFQLGVCLSIYILK